MDRLTELNHADEDRATALVEPLIERAPEIAANVARRRPFDGADALVAAIRAELLELGEPACLDLFRAHPELAPDNPLTMTAESQSEQGRLNLTAEDNAYRARLSGLNARYREKFGFPFITALVRHADIDSVLTELETRLANDRDVEIHAALDQITAVSAARVRASFGPNEPLNGRSVP